MIKRAVERHVKLLQAGAAVIAIGTALYSLAVKPYLMAAPVLEMVCDKLTAKDADSMDCDGQELRLIGDGTPGLTGIDAPEVAHAKCAKERELGVLAVATVNSLLPAVRRVEDTGIRDPYLRPLVRLRMKDRTLLEHELLRRGLAVIWTPAYVPRWCDEIGKGAAKTGGGGDE